MESLVAEFCTTSLLSVIMVPKQRSCFNHLFVFKLEVMLPDINGRYLNFAPKYVGPEGEEIDPSKSIQIAAEERVEFN